MVALGTQDDFAYAQEFISSGGLTDSEVTFLWDPSFTTWQAFGVRTNSTMALLSGDLATTSNTFFGFDDEVQQAVLDAVADFS